VLVADRLADLRSVQPWSAEVTLDASLMALSGRLRLREGSARSAEEIVEELWRRHFASLDAEVGSPDEQVQQRAPAGGDLATPGKA